MKTNNDNIFYIKIEKIDSKYLKDDIETLKINDRLEDENIPYTKEDLL